MPRLLTWQKEPGNQQGDARQMQSLAVCFGLQVILMQVDPDKTLAFLLRMLVGLGSQQTVCS